MSNTLEKALQNQEYFNQLLKYQRMAIITALYDSRQMMLDQSELANIELTADPNFLPLALQGGTAKDTNTGTIYLHVQTIADNVDSYKNLDNREKMDVETQLELVVSLLGLKIQSDGLGLEFNATETDEILEGAEILTLLNKKK